MRRALLIAALAFAVVPATAQAKELTGFTLCGPGGCTTTDVTGLGRQEPFSGLADAAPPGAYLEATLLVDGGVGWRMFYVREQGLLAILHGDAGANLWWRPVPRLATALKRAARDLRPYPGPRVTAVTVGTRRVEDGAATYLRLFGLRGPYADPGSGHAEPIRFVTATPSPWTSEPLTYYPDTDVLAGAGRWIRLPSGLAADVEAARALDGPAGGASLAAWTVTAVLAAATLLAAVLAVVLVRRRPSAGRVAAAAPRS